MDGRAADVAAAGGCLAHALRCGTGLLAGDEYAGDLLPATGLVTSSEEYYPTVAINALMRTLRDPSMSSHHPQARGAIRCRVRVEAVGSGSLRAPARGLAMLRHSA